MIPPTLILCGGEGKRLLPHTDNIPKPLVEVNGRPILSYIIERVKLYDPRKIIVATGYMANKISSYISNSYAEYDITLSYAGDVDIIERVKLAAQYFEEDAIILYGDTISDIDLHELYSFSNSHRQIATISVWRMRSQFGIVEIEANDNVLSFIEKPILNYWINIGYIHLKKEAIKLLYEFDSFEQYLSYLAKNNNLTAFKHHGDHITINTVEELKIAESSIDKLKII